MNSNNVSNFDSWHTSSLVIIGIILFASRFIGLLSPEARVWGFSHLQFLSGAEIIVYTCFILVFLFLLIDKLNIGISSVFDKAGGIFESKPIAVFAGMIIVASVLFWSFRMPTNFLGDGYAVINNIGNEMPVVYKWTERGAIAIVDALFRALPVAGLEGARLAYGAVSVFSGILSILFYTGIAIELTQERRERIFVFLILLFSGTALMYFGYAENYPLLYALTSGYIYVSLRYLNAKSGIWLPVLFLAGALAIHLQSLFFLPSLFILLAQRQHVEGFIARHRRFLVGIVAFCFISGCAIFGFLYNHSLSFQVHFVPLFSSRPPVFDYTVFSVDHLLDIFNEISLLIPTWPLLILMGFIGVKSVLRSAIGRYLFSLAACGLILIFIIDPRLGMARDWDMFSIVGISFSLLLIRGVLQSPHSHKKYLPTVALLSGILILPFFAVNLKYQPSIDYYSSLLKLDTIRSKSGMGILRDYYANNDQVVKADSINQRMADVFPNIELLERGGELLRQKQPDKALAIAESVANEEPFNPEPYALRGSTYLMKRNFTAAKRDFETAVQLEPYNSGNQYNLGQLLFYQKQYDDALVFFRRGLALEPKSFTNLQGAANVFYAMQQYDSALYYFEQAIQSNGKDATSYLMAGYCAYYTRDRKKVKRYLHTYMNMVPDSPQRQTVEQILKRVK